jgi:hypothetical protein
MKRFLRRCATTALKVPIALAWDAVTLGNYGDGSSTARVVRDHQRQRQADETLDLMEDLCDLARRLR